jgi:protein-tyrosine phosphatase
MAEALLKHALQAEEEPFRSLKVISTGVSSFSGEPPAVNTVKVLKEVGIKIEGFKSQQLTYQIVRRSFAIFCMTESHRVTVEMSFDNCPQHLYLMRELMEGTQEYTIPDPYGLNIDAYRACRDSMVECIPAILRFLKREYLPSQKNT